MSQPPTALTGETCPECGAPLPTPFGICWLCQRKNRPENPYSPPATAPSANATGAGQFSLATVFLVMTLIAVCLGTFHFSPGLGVVIVIVAAPALIRTCIVGVKEKRVGHPLSIGEKLIAFLASIAIVILVAVAGFVAFQIACWGSCAAVAGIQQNDGDFAVWTGVIIGGAAGLGVMGWLLWRTRPRTVK